MSLAAIASPLLQFRLMPEDASTVSGRADALYFYLVAVSTFFAALIFVLVAVFAIKYRRSRYPKPPADAPHGNLKLEIVWIGIPFILVMIMFGWGAKLYVDIRTPPADALDVFVVGRQWMWKLQHPNGRREINELHMPVNRPVRLHMISEDVIHSFFVPAFRVKQDVLPGYYSDTWFEATKIGEYHLFCAEYCGTQHSSMIGHIVVMQPDDYQHWLAGTDTGKSMVELGQDLFTGRGSCLTCHNSSSGPRGPDLGGVFGRTVTLQNGKTLVADENYLRESILRPASKIVSGYENLMPPYEGQLSEEEVLHLIAYMKSLSPGQSPHSANIYAAIHAARDRAGRSSIMSTITIPEPQQQPRLLNYLNASYTAKSWLLTTDHKRIGIMFLISVTAFFFLGGSFAVLIRLDLMTPAGDLVRDETYNKLFTMHGIIMIFFFLIPAVPSVLGNFLLPLMIGARDLAFPKLNLLSWYVFTLGGLFTLSAVISGGVDTGWTFYTPYSSTYANTHVIVTAVGVFITGFSSILTGLNFIVTIHTMRAPGMTWFRLPLFVWAHYATSIIQVLGTPVLAITIALVGIERGFHIGIFDPKLGGDPLLFQHLFWFYSHPAVYIMILPSMGVISELVTCFSRRRIFGYGFVAVSSLLIAVYGFLVWGHHMFVSGQSTYAGMIFSFLSFFVAIPSAIKVFNWTATLYKGSISYQTPMLYVFGFIGLFTIGGLTGLFLATLATDVHVTDTYFVVAHFHYIMVGGAIMGYLGGLHFWWPKITGRMYPEGWAKLAALIIFIGFNLTFFPQFLLGYLGMPRRYHVYPEEFQLLNVLSSAGASILGVGYLIPMIYFLWSLRWGPAATSNPWSAAGLEWETTSPPPTDNFEETPIVTREAYDYESPPEPTGGLPIGQ